MSKQPGLKVFGFPVDVRPGFLILMGLFVLASGGDRIEQGVFFALCVGVFTLIHELGHAFAARATGAEASIALDFMAGYASFEPTRVLKRWEKAGISLAGPGVQIVLGTAILLIMRVNPFDIEHVRESHVTIAIWWAGPLLGLINLAPILPLDGGNIVMNGLDRFIPGRSRIVMVWFSLGLTVAMLLYFSLVRRNPYSGFFFIFPLVVQIQMLQHRRTQAQLDTHGSWHRWATAAERDAWNTGRVGSFPPGMVASPWYRAAALARAGRVDEARGLLLADFESAVAPNWLPPEVASERELEALVALLPRPLPTGNAYSEYVLASILIRLGEFDEAGRYAAQSYTRWTQTMPAVIVAQCAAALGDNDLAVRWLRAAYDAGTNRPGLAEAIDERSEFATVRHDPQVVQLRHELLSTT
jgi:Zn-dependent protease